uniref:Uncharacterized protein n=1 Tax=Sphaerodactylus townsendi TaxID=933632 RepID=A0ACB8G9K7_9SAUR
MQLFGTAPETLMMETDPATSSLDSRHDSATTLQKGSSKVSAVDGRQSTSDGSSLASLSPARPPQFLCACNSKVCCMSPNPTVCQFPIMPWGQLPASYTAGIASNGMAPLLLPLLFTVPPMSSLPSCPYSPAAYLDSAYWNMVAASRAVLLLGHTLDQKAALQTSKGMHASSFAPPTWYPLPGTSALLNTGLFQAAADGAQPQSRGQPLWLSQPYLHTRQCLPNENGFACSMWH